MPGAQTNDATVNSLLFEDASALSLGSNTLSVTSGAIESITNAASSITGGTLTGPGGLAFNTDGTATQTVSSSIAGGGAFSLNKLGTGTLILTGNSTYGGTTNVFEGTLDVQSSNALGSSPAYVRGAATMNVSQWRNVGDELHLQRGHYEFPRHQQRRFLQHCQHGIVDLYWKCERRELRPLRRMAAARRYSRVGLGRQRDGRDECRRHVRYQRIDNGGTTVGSIAGGATIFWAVTT